MLSTPDQLDRLSRRSDGLGQTVVPLAKRHRGVLVSRGLWRWSEDQRPEGKNMSDFPDVFYKPEREGASVLGVSGRQAVE